jgi:hypothetical protein
LLHVQSLSRNLLLGNVLNIFPLHVFVHYYANILDLQTFSKHLFVNFPLIFAVPLFFFYLLG